MAKKLPKKRRGRVRNYPFAKHAKKLRQLGFNVSDKNSIGKYRIKKIWRAVAGYINFSVKDRVTNPATGKTVNLSEGEKLPPPTKYRFKYISFFGDKPTRKKREKEKAFKKRVQEWRSSGEEKRDSLIQSKIYSANQITPNGFFVELPANVDSQKYRIDIGPNGEVRTRYKERNDVAVRMDAADFAKDPIKTARDLLKKFVPEVSRAKRAKKKEVLRRKTPIGFSLLVNGYHSSHRSTTIKSFLWYLQNRLLPDWLENNDEKTAKNFADEFHLRILY